VNVALLLEGFKLGKLPRDFRIFTHAASTSGIPSAGQRLGSSRAASARLPSGAALGLAALLRDCSILASAPAC